MSTKKSYLTKAVIAASLAAIASVSAPAFAAGALTLTWAPIMLDKVTTVDGTAKHTLVDPSVTHDKVVPGSHLVFAADYANNGTSPGNLNVVDPLPAAVMLSDDGFGSFDVSVDGGKTFGKLANLTVKDASGSARAAQASDVTTLRWTISSVAPGASGKLEFHGIVR